MSVTLSPEVARKAIRAAYQVKLIDDDGLALAKQSANSNPKQTMLHELLEAKKLDPIKACQILGKLYQLKVITFKEHDINPDAVRKLPKDFIIRNQVIPLDLDNNVLRLAVADPTKATLQGQIAQMAKCDIVMSVAPIPHIAMALQANTIVNAIDAPLEEDKPKKAPKKKTKAADDDELLTEFPLRRKYKMEDGEGIVDLVNDILIDAIEYDVSDIHIEPYRRTARMRWRLDGVMKEQNQYQSLLVQYYAAIMARMKLMAGCDISERRLPQDGAITIQHKGEEIDFRFNIMPTKYGERPVLRKLQGTPDLTLDNLGFDPDDYVKINDAIRQPQGMVLVTGPTGSGKSTTLFACLLEINKPELNILTAEDPVEYYLEGAGQVQANEQIGLTFASILRGFLRQDPEVILVGEIRDKETIDIAIKAALTGHLLLSTLHTNDAVGTVVRLLNMGVPSFMIASALSLIVAQRLARRNCKNCLIDDPAGTEANLRKVGFSDAEIPNVQPKKGAGCKKCGGSGYKGRQGLYEVMSMNEQLELAILNEAQAPELLAAAKTTGFKTMQEIGRTFIESGVICLEEYQRVLVVD
jgi:type IV pilus assembly protein PilB